MNGIRHKSHYQFFCSSFSLSFDSPFARLELSFSRLFFSLFPSSLAVEENKFFYFFSHTTFFLLKSATEEVKRRVRKMRGNLLTSNWNSFAISLSFFYETKCIRMKITERKSRIIPNFSTRSFIQILLEGNSLKYQNYYHKNVFRHIFKLISFCLWKKEQLWLENIVINLQ